MWVAGAGRIADHCGEVDEGADAVERAAARSGIADVTSHLPDASILQVRGKLVLPVQQDVEDPDGPARLEERFDDRDAELRRPGRRGIQYHP